MWEITYLNQTAKDEVEDLPLDLRSSFERIAAMIQSAGLERMREPYVKHLDGKL